MIRGNSANAAIDIAGRLVAPASHQQRTREKVPRLKTSSAAIVAGEAQRQYGAVEETEPVNNGRWPVVKGEVYFRAACPFRRFR